MIRAQSADARMLERLHAQGMETYSMDADPKDYETGRFWEILSMIRRGACYEEVRDWYEENRARFEGRLGHGHIDRDLYEVYVKVASGTTAHMEAGMEGRPYKPDGKVALRRRMVELASFGYGNAEIAMKLRRPLAEVRAVLGDEV